MSKEQFNNIGIVLRKDTPAIHENTIHIIGFLIAEGKNITLDEVSFNEIGKELIESKIDGKVLAVPLNILGQYSDIVIVIGGDGTLLTVARNIVDYDIPIIGINRGRLGFLTQVPWESESIKTIQEILSGQYIKETRIILEGKIVRGGNVLHESLAMNEVTLSRGGQGNLIQFEVFVNGEFVYTQYSDGLIIATPTGSTAYSLAAGGPILYATLPALNLVPICPQSMTNRPVVIDANSHIEILIVNSVDSRAHFDGQTLFELCNRDIIHVKKHKNSITLLQPEYYRYFDTLRMKLRWGEQLI
ncbi:MAG: NAD(+)/NADH kinase [Neisseriaceae bacterium]|nr:NAD(+)/NADH kinase [Neisseriaceae bacterium]